MPIIGKATRERLVNKFQSQFDKDVRRIAKRANTKGVRTRDVHREAKKAIRQHTLTQAMLGKGRPLSNAELTRLEKTIKKEEEHLQRFMDQISIRRVQRNPMSSEAIESRLIQYGGTGRAEYYRASELVDSDQNTVERYRANAGACSKCLPYNGKYFLPGEGPMPGDVCLGKGHCRCERIAEQNKRKAKELRS